MQGKRKIYLSEFDMERLNRLIDALLEEQSNVREKKHLELLEEVLREAEVVAPEKIPRNIVTMNSKIRVRNLESNMETVYQLVFPGKANAAENRISVLAPVGAAIIGCKVGGVVRLQVPAGFTRLRIEEIEYQPEAAGDFHL